MKRLRNGCLLVLLLIVMLAISSKPASTLGPGDIEFADTELIATADAMITGGEGWQIVSWGDEFWFHIGHDDSESRTSRFLLRFDLTQIPNNAQISSASLRLYCTYSEGEDNMNVTAYRITQDWSETRTTWNDMADHYAEAYDTTAISWRGSVYHYHYWDIPELVQAWVDGTYPNYGVMLIGYEGPDNNFREFYSREMEYGDQPCLYIDWSTPSPTPTNTPVAYVYLPMVLKSRPPTPTPTPTRTPGPTPTSTPEPGWIEIVYEDFEGDFPTGLWHTSQDCEGGSYTWAPRDCRPHAGNKSAWCVGGGADGSQLECGSDYPDEALTQLIYGPFDLSDATAAKMTFWTWSSTEYESDTIYWGASTNGWWFWGERDSGSWNSFWDSKELDFAWIEEWGERTSYLGEPEVWVMFSFESDEWFSYEGWFVDDVQIVKKVGGAGMPNETPAPSDTEAGVVKRRISQ